MVSSDVLSVCQYLNLLFETFAEVKVVVVFDAMMSGLPTHKESFVGYIPKQS
jgi:hypothetical protein